MYPKRVTTIAVLFTLLLAGVCVQLIRLQLVQGTVYAELACNLANAEESDLREQEIEPRGDVEIVAPVRRPIWFYLVAAALCLTTVEWYLYQRRWIS